MVMMRWWLGQAVVRVESRAHVAPGPDRLVQSTLLWQAGDDAVAALVEPGLCVCGGWRGRWRHGWHHHGQAMRHHALLLHAS